MKTYKKIIPGLVIELPRDKKHYGVILDATKVNDWFKVTIVCYDGFLATCRLQIKEDGEYLRYRNYHVYNAAELVKDLNHKYPTI